MLALLLALGGCVSGPSGPAGPDPVVVLRDRWTDCVVRATAANPGRFAAPEAATEMGFSACVTEEGSLRAYFIGLGTGPADLEPVMAIVRQRIKASIVRIIREATTQQRAS